MNPDSRDYGLPVDNKYSFAPKETKCHARDLVLCIVCG